MSHISQKEFETVNWLPIKEKYKLKLKYTFKSKYKCVNSIVFKYFDNQYSHYLNEVFIEAPESSLSLRNSYQKFQQPFHKTSTGQNALSFIDPTFWNKISEEIKRITNLNTFKHNFKKYYLKEIVMSNF